MSFSLERFIERCRACAADEKAVLELVSEAFSEPRAVEAGVPAREHAGFEVLYRAPELTVLNFAWAPWMCFKPHNHTMWSVVGIISGREDNVFWRRTEDAIEAAGARSLGAGDVTLLGRDAIHSVVNPVGKPTRAIHVYGGDFFSFSPERYEWEPESLARRAWDVEHSKRLFVEAEARAAALRPASTPS